MILKTLKKSKPFFGAGKRFGWAGAGLGINSDLLYDERIDTFEILVGIKKPLYIMRSKALLSVTSYDSWMKGRGNKVIGVVPYFAFSNVKDIIKSVQPKLF